MIYVAIFIAIAFVCLMACLRSFSIADDTARQIYEAEMKAQQYK